MDESETRYEAFLDLWPNPDDKHLIRDGAFDWNLWQAAHPRVMFLLKEAYAMSESFTDVRDMVRKRDKPKNQTWSRLADWAYLAQEGMNVSARPGQISKAERYQSLRSCALINIKKSGGVSQSDNTQIKEIAIEHGKELLHQIELLDPQIVICGNTWKAMEAVFNLHQIPCDESPYDYVRIVQDRYFIKSVHPAIRSSKLLSYSIPYLLQQAGAWKELSAKRSIQE